MEKCNFETFIDAIEKYDNEAERWNDFGIELYGLPIYEITWEIINMYLEEIFLEEGIDWINWYLFERKNVITGEVLPCYDENDKPFYVNNAKDLWNLVERYQK